MRRFLGAVVLYACWALLLDPRVALGQSPVPEFVQRLVGCYALTAHDEGVTIPPNLGDLSDFPAHLALTAELTEWSGEEGGPSTYVALLPNPDTDTLMPMWKRTGWFWEWRPWRRDSLYVGTLGGFGSYDLYVGTEGPVFHGRVNLNTDIIEEGKPWSFDVPLTMRRIDWAEAPPRQD